MSYPNLFFFIFLSTITVSRVCLAVWELKTKTVFQKLILREMEIHHYVYGLPFMLVSLFMMAYPVVQIIFFAIGFGLFADEIPLLYQILKWGSEDYDSTFSRLGVLIIILLVFYFRNYYMIVPFHHVIAVGIR